MAPRTSKRPVLRGDAEKKKKREEAAKRKKVILARQNQMVEAAEGKPGSTPSEKNKAAKDRMSKMFGMKLKNGGAVTRKKLKGGSPKAGFPKRENAKNGGMGTKGGPRKRMARGGKARK
jgi:hypothetical protein